MCKGKEKKLTARFFKVFFSSIPHPHKDLLLFEIMKETCPGSNLPITADSAVQYKNKECQILHTFRSRKKQRGASRVGLACVS